MRRTVCCLLFTLTGTQVALAQDCPPAPPNGGPPTLHLSETATVHVQPSLLVADLVANAESPVAVTAQRRVNDLMAKASTSADKVAGVTAAFQDYSTTFVDRSTGVAAHWVASQTLELRGKTADVLLALVGQLQALGLSVGNLGWQVPDAELDAAGQKARLEALVSLRQEAAAAAKALGLEVAGYSTIDLTSGPTPIFNGPRPMMATMAMPAPMATRDDQAVTATVTADVVLRPPSGAKAASH